MPAESPRRSVDPVVLSEWIGCPVVDADGTERGRLADVIVRVGHRSPVCAVIIKSGSSRIRAAWSDVEPSEDLVQRLIVRGEQGDSPSWRRDDGEPPLADDEVCLARDVLDCQIVDLNGYRLVRVGDVLLERIGPDEIEVVAVEVGIRAVLDRLGWHWLAHRFAQQAVRWDEMHLTSRRGHQAQLAAVDATLHRLDAAALAQLLDKLSADATSDVFEAIPPARSTALLHDVDDEIGSRLLRRLPEDRAEELLQALPHERASRYRHLLHRAHVPTRRLSRSRGHAHPRWRRIGRNPA